MLKEHLGYPADFNLMGHRILSEEDFKLIKQLKMKKKAAEVKEKLKLELNLNNYEVIDERLVGNKNPHKKQFQEDDEDQSDDEDAEGEDEEAEGEDIDEDAEGEDLEDMDDELEAEGEEGEFDADDESGESEELSNPEEAKIGNKRVKFGDFELVDLEVPEGKKRSDGINYVSTAFEDKFEQYDDEDFSVDSQDEEDENPHGFLEGHHLDTYRRSRVEKRAEQLITKATELSGRAKRNHVHKHLTKNRGTTNKEKLKNKPMMMVKPKKLKKLNNNYRSAKERIKEIKTKLGKIREGRLRVKRKARISK